MTESELKLKHVEDYNENLARVNNNNSYAEKDRKTRVKRNIKNKISRASKKRNRRK